MRYFKDLKPNEQKDLQDSLKDLKDVAKDFEGFNREYEAALKKHKSDYIAEHFDDIFSIAKDFGIGSGLMSFGSAQSVLKQVASSIKRIAIYPNASLH